MPLDMHTLCRYRMARAEEDLLTAENNHQSGFYKAAINRSYYAIFHSFERGMSLRIMMLFPKADQILSPGRGY